MASTGGLQAGLGSSLTSSLSSESPLSLSQIAVSSSSSQPTTASNLLVSANASNPITGGPNNAGLGTTSALLPTTTMTTIQNSGSPSTSSNLRVSGTVAGIGGAQSGSGPVVGLGGAGPPTVTSNRYAVCLFVLLSYSGVACLGRFISTNFFWCIVSRSSQSVFD